MWRLAIVGLLAMGVSYMHGAPSEERDVAAIIDSGSTNRPGFRIVREGIPAGTGEVKVRKIPLRPAP
jgi:hypothetical protein